jgi:hypothetical protein
LFSLGQNGLTVTDGEVEECVDPGGNRAMLNVGEGGGPGPAKRGRKRAVGIGQWRRLDVQDAGKLKGRARHNTKTALCTEYISYM